MKKMNFAVFNKMPIKGTKNVWFSRHIKGLGLVMDKSGYVVEINGNNSKIIENDIMSNPSYNSKFALKMYEYHLLKQHNNQNAVKYDRNAITDLVRMIDVENNTNVWRFHNGQITKMVDYIINPVSGNQDFWIRLNKGDIDLVNDLRKSSGASASRDGPRSLASKICKYFSEIFYKKDNYYINDNVVRHVLPYYLNYYGIDSNTTGGVVYDSKAKFDGISYEDLFDFMDKLKNEINKSGGTLTKSQLDHILWYCYRYQKNLEND